MTSFPPLTDDNIHKALGLWLSEEAQADPPSGEAGREFETF